MDNEIKIDDNVVPAFRTTMQKVFTFLSDCAESLEGCTILERLGFQTGFSNEIGKINTTKDQVNGLFRNVTNCQDDVILLDESESNRLEEILTLAQNNEESNENTSSDVKTNGNTSGGKSSGNNGGSSGGMSGGGGGAIPTTNNSEVIENNNEENITEENPDVSDYVQFYVDKETANELGDIFYDSDCSLTKLTNMLLKELKIENTIEGKDQAQILYNAILKYGNDYYTNNFDNPANKLSLHEIATEIYEHYNEYAVKANGNDNQYENLYNILKNALNR